MIKLDNQHHYAETLIALLDDLCTHTVAETSLLLDLDCDYELHGSTEQTLDTYVVLPRTKQESRQGVIDMVNMSVFIICEEFLDKG